MNNLKLARRIQKEEIKEIINTNKKCMSIRTSFKKKSSNVRNASRSN
jgi:hypothetical protein